ncbi:MAG: 2OG-Fe(II) oxygenase [Erythrobacter sp.]|nr:2OG-Fe(II) oxygenase [Erythrobacter sp.]
MLASAAATFEQIARLADPSVNARFLQQLPAGQASAFARANLARRMGDIAAAREALAEHLGDVLHPWSAVPPRLTSHGGSCLVPLVVIDQFLPVERMQALHRHACSRAEHFRHALATNEDAEPEYDPERRETLLDYGFTLERDQFLGFINDNLAVLGDLLGVDPFTVERHEIKLSNHVDGGFFKPHGDSHVPFAEAGRAISWLYYFGDEVPRFSGGELYAIDGQPLQQQTSPAWFTTVVPRANRFVAFPSWFYHAVAPTRLPGNAFAHGRMAVSGHVRKAAGGGSGWWEQG